MSPIYHLDVHTSHDIQKLEMQGQDMQNQMYQIKATESPKEPCEEEQTSIMLLLLPLYTDLAIYAPQLHNVKFPEKKKWQYLRRLYTNLMQLLWEASH